MNITTQSFVSWFLCIDELISVYWRVDFCVLTCCSKCSLFLTLTTPHLCQEKPLWPSYNTVQRPTEWFHIVHCYENVFLENNFLSKSEEYCKQLYCSHLGIYSHSHYVFLISRMWSRQMWCWMPKAEVLREHSSWMTGFTVWMLVRKRSPYMEMLANNVAESIWTCLL